MVDNVDMSSVSKLLLLFLVGLVLGFILFFNNPFSLPINNRLPDLIFPKSTSPLTIIFTGDVMLGRSVNTRIIKYSDPTWPFLKIASVLTEGDLTIINLESPFIENCQPIDNRMIFCSDSKNIAGLVFAGIDVASLANNHIENQGQKGIDETINLLKKNNITPITNGKTEFKTLKDTNIAIIAFSDFPQIDDDLVKKEIEGATKSANLVITTFHWGAEYQRKPTLRQIFLAHLAIDSGADVVVGHHPHWIQTNEIYQGKPIYYSLGNLIFDQMWSEETRLGEILKLTYQDSVLTKKEIFPIKIFDFGQPSLNYP